MGTIRQKLLKVAARAALTARRVVFLLASSYPYHATFGAILARVMSPPAGVIETS